MTTWLSRGLVVAAAGGLLLLVLLAALHTAPARSFLLRRAVFYLADRFDLSLDARSLRYNLVTRRLTLSSVTLASTQARQDPFLTADLIEVTVPPTAFFGTLSVERLRLEHVRVAIHRRPDGSSNLPSRESSGDVDPPTALAIGQIVIPRLAIVVADEASGFSLSLPNVSVDVGPEAGQLRLIDAGLAKGNETTSVKTLGGGVAFDGRSVHLSQFTIVTDEADATLDGEIALLVSDPHLDLQLSGRGDVADLARWATSSAAPEGTVTFDATIAGALPSPGIVSHLRSDSLSYQGVTVSNVAADLAIDRSRLEATRVEMSLANGRVTANGRLTFASSDTSVGASWSDLSLEQLGRLFAGRHSTLPAGRASGEASFTGVPSEVATWNVQLSNRIAPVRAASGHLTVEGEASLRVDERHWRLEGMHLVAGAPVRTSLRGDVDPTDLAGSSLIGTVEARDADLSRLVNALAAAGVL